MRIRILLLINVMGICYHWSIDPLSLQGSIVSVNGPPLLYFELLKFLNVGNNADPDTAFHSEADPDPASKLMRIRIHNTAKRRTYVPTI